MCRLNDLFSTPPAQQMRIAPQYSFQDGEGGSSTSGSVSERTVHEKLAQRRGIGSPFHPSITLLSQQRIPCPFRLCGPASVVAKGASVTIKIGHRKRGCGTFPKFCRWSHKPIRLLFPMTTSVQIFCFLNEACPLSMDIFAISYNFSIV